MRLNRVNEVNIKCNSYNINVIFATSQKNHTIRVFASLHVIANFIFPE